MIEISLSKHFIEDRAERYATIATKVGLGEVVMTTHRPLPHGEGYRVIELTSTGVFIIKSHDGVVITVYCATLTLVKSYFGVQRLSKGLYNAIRLNERKGYCHI